MALLEIENPANARHIHKGATFSIGTAKNLKELPRDDRMLAAELIASGAVGDATDPKVVKTVQDEIAAEESRQSNLTRLDAAGSNAQVSALLQEVLRRVAVRAAQ